MTGEGSPVEQAQTVDMYTVAIVSAENAMVHALDAPCSISEHNLGQIRRVLLPGFDVTLRDNHHENGALDIVPPLELPQAQYVGKMIAWLTTGKESEPRIIDVSGETPELLVENEDGEWRREPLSP